MLAGPDMKQIDGNVPLCPRGGWRPPRRVGIRLGDLMWQAVTEQEAASFSTPPRHHTPNLATTVVGKALGCEWPRPLRCLAVVGPSGSHRLKRAAFVETQSVGCSPEHSLLVFELDSFCL